MTDSPTTDWHGLPGVDIYGKDLFQKKGEVHPEGRVVFLWRYCNLVFSRPGLILSGRVGLEFLDSSPGRRIEH